MTIQKAIKLLKKKKNKGRTISSEKAVMYEQSRSSFLYWLFEDIDNIQYATDTYLKILDADDWSFDEQDTE